MTQHLSPADVSVLALETMRSAAHLGTVAIFDAGPGELDFSQLLELIEDRLAYVPRYRQKVRFLPPGLGGPIWVDDEDFELSFHVRQSGLPRPGSMGQLEEFVAELMARRLDRSRPLWEIHHLDGLADHRCALVIKSHLCLVDGIDHVEIGQVLLEAEPSGPLPPAQHWQPQPQPGLTELVTGAVRDGIEDPGVVVDQLRRSAAGALGLAVAVFDAVGLGDSVEELRTAAAGGAQRISPLTGPLSTQRRYVSLSTDLDRYRRISSAYDCTINDVILTVIGGGLRGWLLEQGIELTAATSLTALAPMSVAEESAEPSALGSTVAPAFVELPIGEGDASVRLTRLAGRTRRQAESAGAVSAQTLTEIAGFAPSTLHALAAKLSAHPGQRPYDVLISNAPGPRGQLYAAADSLLASYPVTPLAAGHLLSIGVTSYSDLVQIGVTADRRLGDLEPFARALHEAERQLAESRPAHSDTRTGDTRTGQGSFPDRGEQ